MTTKELAEDILSIVRNYFEINEYAIRNNYEVCVEHIQEVIDDFIIN